MKRSSILLAPLILLFAIPPGCGPGNSVAVAFPNGRTVQCEIADSPKKQEEGLTTYASLAPHQGMLFAYPQERFGLTFWMPNRMKFQIDMIFLDGEKKVLLIEKKVPICESNISSDCDSYGPRDRGVRYVVEVVAGFCDEVSLKNGDRLQFDLP